MALVVWCNVSIWLVLCWLFGAPYLLFDSRLWSSIDHHRRLFFIELLGYRLRFRIFLWCLTLPQIIDSWRYFCHCCWLMKSLWQVSWRPSEETPEGILASSPRRGLSIFMRDFDVLKFSLTNICFASMWKFSRILCRFRRFLSCHRYCALIRRALSALVAILRGLRGAKQHLYALAPCSARIGCLSHFRVIKSWMIHFPRQVLTLVGCERTVTLL